MTGRGALGLRAWTRGGGVLVRADGGPVDCLPTSGGLWGGGRAMTCGPHVTWSCRATQPWVQSSLASGYQLPAALRGGLASGPGRADQVRAPGPLRHGPASRSLRIRRRSGDGLRRGVSMLDQVQGAFPSDSPASPSPWLNQRKGTLCFDRAAGGESL